MQSTGNGTPNFASPNLADARTQGGAAEPQSTRQPGAAALFKSLSMASNGPVDARLPRLNLRSVSMPENSDGTLSISRYGPKPEMGSIGVTHRGPPPKRPYEAPPSVPEVPPRTELAIELVLPAFSLDPAAVASAQAAGTDLSAAALRRASRGLGVDQSALRLFEMREVAHGAQLAEDADHVAVAIIGSSAVTSSKSRWLRFLVTISCATRLPYDASAASHCDVRARPHVTITPCFARAGFSLSALEETMQENKRLSNSAAQSASQQSVRQGPAARYALLTHWVCALLEPLLVINNCRCVNGRRVCSGGHAEACEGPESGTGQGPARRTGGAGPGAKPAGAVPVPRGGCGISTVSVSWQLQVATRADRVRVRIRHHVFLVAGEQAGGSALLWRRQQLQRSEDLRQQGQRALGELKLEFDELTHDIAEGGLDDSPAKPKTAEAPSLPHGTRDAKPSTIETIAAAQWVLDLGQHRP